MQRKPLELSGGEQQRVAIARAMIVQPKLLLADEPTGNLDYSLALEIMDMFSRINKEGTTVLVATHDQELIQQIPHRVIALENGNMVSDSRPHSAANTGTDEPQEAL